MGSCDGDSSSGSKISSSRKNGPAVVRIGPSKVATSTAAAAAAAGTASLPPPAPTLVVASSSSSTVDTGDTAAIAAAAASDGATTASGEEILEMEVVVNPPAVTSLECPIALPMAGFSIVPQAEAEFATGMGWEWLREEDGPAEDDDAGGGGVGGGVGDGGDAAGKAKPGRGKGRKGRGPGAGGGNGNKKSADRSSPSRGGWGSPQAPRLCWRLFSCRAKGVWAGRGDGWVNKSGGLCDNGLMKRQLQLLRLYTRIQTLAAMTTV